MVMAPLLAASRTYLRFARLHSLDEWWHWGALACVVIALVAIVVFFHRRDSVELNRPLRWLLLVLRLSVFATLMMFFLGLEKRSEQLLVRNSRAIVLMDTSQSMSLTDEVVSDGQGQEGNVESRIARGIESLQTPSGLIATLRAQHDVIVYRGDEQQRPEEVAAYPSYAEASPEVDADSQIGSLAEARRLALITLLLAGVALLGLGLAIWTPSWLRGGDGENWALLVGVVFLLTTLVVAAVNNVRNPEFGWYELATGARPDSASVPETAEQAGDQPAAAEVDLTEALTPSGSATRLGDALTDILGRERGGPLAGIAVLTDGNNNAGVSLHDAAELASRANVPIFPVGIGNDQPPTSARIVDIEAPSRVFPGDAFKIKAYVQSFGYEGATLPIRLTESAQPQGQGEGGPPTDAGTLLDERLISAEADGHVGVVEFEVPPPEEGSRLYTISITVPGSDVDESDNRRSAVVRVVDRKTQVLLLAGGPTREYRFVRNLCHRDKEVTTHVLLQSSPDNATQDADQILHEFPSDAETLFAYDAIVAFDPNWDELSQSQLELLEQWVAEKAGGLVVVAGPVYMPEWTRRQRTRTGDRILRALYPVQFYGGATSVLGRTRYSATTAWPLEFTPEGQAAEHLKWGGVEGGSEGWDAFPGVYGYFPVRGTKPGATVLARFSDPDTRIEEVLPPFLVYQFYGAGRVYYIASGEFWRLHEISEGAYESLYTRLIRFVSEGRLLRDSNRGVLMVDKERAAPGETIMIRCTLTDAQFNPAQLPKLDATVVFPDQRREMVVLNPVDVSGRPGNYVGQVTVAASGDYRIELPVPDSPELEILTKSVRVRVPDREVESPQRNDARLLELAELTGGTYFVGTDAALASGTLGLAGQMVPQDQQTYLPGTPDRAFQQRLMGWYLALICGALSVEWLVRRLNRLA